MAKKPIAKCNQCGKFIVPEERVKNVRPEQLSLICRCEIIRLSEIINDESSFKNKNGDDGFEYLDRIEENNVREAVDNLKQQIKWNEGSQVEGENKQKNESTDSPNGKKPDSNPKVILANNWPEIWLYYSRIVWGFSLLGFLYFWWFYDPTVSFAEGGGRIMNLPSSSIKSSGMLGCSVFLIVSSIYIMACHILAVLLRIEKLFDQKERPNQI